MDSNVPPFSFFTAPEGVYTLVSNLNVPAPGASNASTSPFSPSGGVAAPPASVGLGGPTTPAPEQPAAPPPHPARLAVVAVQLPSKEGGGGGGGAGISGLGLSIGRGKGRDEGAGATPITGSGGDASGYGDGASNGGGAGGVSANGQGGPPSSPATKRKPLTSSFSMLGGLALAGDGVPTSRPARALKGSSSSFVRSWDGLPLSQVQMRGLGDANVGRDTIFGFQTIGKTLVMSEIAKGKDALARVIFASFPTCVDANQHTASGSQIDVLVGFATGDIIWLDPLTARYSRYNKSGCITSSPVTSILWLPPAPPTSPTSPAGDNGLTSPRSNLFVTSHADGSIVLWDKDKEDWNGFLAQPFPAPASVANTPGHGGGGFARGSEWSSSSEGGATRGEGGGGKVAAGQEDMVVSRPPTTADRKGQSTAKFNPVAHWRLSKKAITAFAFSPDLTLCAAVGDDGCLRIIDAVEEKLLDVFSSYFGALNCVAWSPDGRFVVTGGQDDLCTVYAPLEQHVVAHCQGHASWVKGVAWDAWRSEDRTLRFASVGEDCKLVLWDLSSASLTRPKAHAHPHVRRHSTSSQTSLHRRSISESGPHLPLDPSERAGPAFHPAPRRDDVSLLQPIMVKTLSTDLFSDVHILPEYLILGTRVGQVRQYDRPPTGDGSLTGLSSEFAASVVRIDARAR